MRGDEGRLGQGLGKWQCDWEMKLQLSPSQMTQWSWGKSNSPGQLLEDQLGGLFWGPLLLPRLGNLGSPPAALQCSSSEPLQSALLCPANIRSGRSACPPGPAWDPKNNSFSFVHYRPEPCCFHGPGPLPRGLVSCFPSLLFDNQGCLPSATKDYLDGPFYTALGTAAGGAVSNSALHGGQKVSHMPLISCSWDLV